MDCVGYRLKEGTPYQVDPGMTVYLKAYQIPRNPAFNVPKPWWSVDIMYPGGKCHKAVTIWEDDEATVELPPGMYWIRFNGLVKATPRELQIHACLLQEGCKQNYPLRPPRMACVESGVLGNATIKETGKSLNLAGHAKSYLLFQPTEAVKGTGQAEVTLEHSSDNKTWEPVYHGGFPGSKIIIDQSKPSVIYEQMALNGVHQYVRWAYNPTNVLGWGVRGQFYYEYESRHRS